MWKGNTLINQDYNLHIIHYIQSELRKVLVDIVNYIFIRILQIFILRLRNFLKYSPSYLLNTSTRKYIIVSKIQDLHLSIWCSHNQISISGLLKSKTLIRIHEVKSKTSPISNIDNHERISHELKFL